MREDARSRRVVQLRPGQLDLLQLAQHLDAEVLNGFLVVGVVRVCPGRVSRPRARRPSSGRARSCRVLADRAFSAAEGKKGHLQMGSILPSRVAVLPSRRKGGDGDRRRAPTAEVLPGRRLWCGVLDLPSL